MRECEFTDAIVKIGRISTSELQLEEIARMHAVLERTGSTWRVLDLGSSTGTSLDGKFVDQHTVLPKEGSLEFGKWTVTYEILDATWEVLDQMAKEMGDEALEEALDTWDTEHHRTMLEGLTVEVRRLSTRAAQLIESNGLERAWANMGTNDKRLALRKLVSAIRLLRQEDQRAQRHRVASMLELGPDGILAVYDLTPEEALTRASEALMSASVAKGALEWLVEMDLVAQVKKTSTKAGDPMVKALITGHRKLIEHIQTTMGRDSSLLLAYISRAGGHELSDEERFEMKRAFDEIERETNRETS